jgi:ribosome-associated protein
MQFVGKLMRKLDEDQVQAIRAALDVQHNGSAEETLALHMAEHWRDRLLQDDAALAEWLSAHPDTDSQQLRAWCAKPAKTALPDKPLCPMVSSHAKAGLPRHLQNRARSPHHF